MGQRERHRRGFRRGGSAAVVFACEIRETEFVVGGYFPQKIRVQVGRLPLRLGDECRRRRLGEAQQHRRRLDLEALSGGAFDLQGRVVVGEDGAGLELAVILEKDVHGGNRARPVAGRSGGEL